MITVVEPKRPIAALWSEPEIRDGETFRLMRYVLRVDHEGKVLLCNVVTGQLAVLDQDEAELVDKLPAEYSPAMKQLVDEHYLVPDQFDEHQRVVKMREVLRKLRETRQGSAITTYTILPTTACNARCYYCFEQGVKTVTMTEKTADDVVKYIAAHCGEEKKVFISWFGGEPTVASGRISRICEGLRRNGIGYSSTITTNGYLFDEEMVHTAKTLWNLTHANITVDGTEETYNRVKAYAGVTDNPYQRVLLNVGRLLDEGIRVGVRMNFDLGNFNEFPNLLEDLKVRFQGSPLLQVNVHPVIGEYAEADGVVSHGTDEWFEGKIVELNDMARSSGMLNESAELPSMQYKGCLATSRSAVTITPEGGLVRCPEQFGEDQLTGNIWGGITNPELMDSWKQFGDYAKCKDCILFPYCLRPLRCSAKDRCCFYQELIQRFQNGAKQVFVSSGDLKGDVQYGIRRTEGGSCQD